MISKTKNEEKKQKQEQITTTTRKEEKMKKILTVSVLAMMAVTAANAEIASKAYVIQEDNAIKNNVIGDLEGLGDGITNTSVVAAINSVAETAAGSITDMVTHDGAVGGETQPVYITSGGVATAGTALGTAAYKAAAAAITDGSPDLVSGDLVHDALALKADSSYVGTIPAASVSAGNNTIVKYVDEQVATANNAVAGLDTTESQTAGDDGLSLSITQLNGLITDISGSIAAGTYDAYGAAAAVAGKMITATSGEGYTGKKSSTTEYPSMATAGQIATDAIGALDGGTISGTGVVKSISQADGQVSASLSKIVNADIDDNAQIAPSKIATDASNRFVTDSDKTTWGAKQNALADENHKGDVVALDGTTGTVTYMDVDGTVTASSPNLVTSGAVASAINTAASASNFVEDSIESTSTAKAPSGHAVSEALALKQNASTAVTHTANTAVGSTSQTVYVDTDGSVKPGTTLGTMATETATDYTKTANLTSSTTATSGQVVTAISMSGGVLSQTTADPLTNAAYEAQGVGVDLGSGTYTLTMKVGGTEQNPTYTYKWELIERASDNE